MKAAVVLLVGILLSTIAATAASVAPGEDGERVPRRVPHVDSSVLVNAVLDEDVWNEALRLELPYEQRETIVLRLHGDLRFRQIAKLRNVSIKTIQSRYRYGLDKLRSTLTEN